MLCHLLTNFNCLSLFRKMMLRLPQRLSVPYDSHEFISDESVHYVEKVSAIKCPTLADCRWQVRLEQVVVRVLLVESLNIDLRVVSN